MGYGFGIWLQLLISTGAVPLYPQIATLALAAMVVAAIAVFMIGGRHK